MEIKYIGPRATINQHGVTFKEGKEDKYVYLKDAMQILRAIKHEYKKDVLYHYDIKVDEISNEDILKEVLTFNNEKEDISIKIKTYENKLNIEIKDLPLHYSNLNNSEIDIYKKNLIIMKEYRKQRAINKIIYTYLIKEIVSFIIENKIKDINAPFNERYWHILQSIQGFLNEEKISSKLNTKNKEDFIIIYLEIKTLFKL